MDEYRSLRCSLPDDADHAICRASYVGVPADEVFCQCRCHVMTTWRTVTSFPSCEMRDQIERRFGL